MNRKLSRLLDSSFWQLFLCLLVFALITAFFSLPLAIAELAIVVALFVFSRKRTGERKKEVLDHLRSFSGSLDTVNRNSMLHSPLPMLIFRPDTDEVIWSNDRFLAITGEREHLFDTKLSSAVPEFSSRWLMEGKTECPGEVFIGDRRFQVFGNLVQSQEKHPLATTYWVDVTTYSNISQQFAATRPVIAMLLLDNYDDLLNNVEDSQRASLLSDINRRLKEWVDPAKGMFLRYSRDRFLFLFEEQYLQHFKEDKFSVLDSVREVLGANNVPATLSIGIGQDGETLEELAQYASQSIDMALSRGGDQVVIKNHHNFEFYGGRAKELEKRTKVKSRVMANALGSLIADSSKLFVMGHTVPDLDAFGACVGVCAIARKLGVPYYIIKEPSATPADSMITKMASIPEYQRTMIPEQDALLGADSGSLLVVVDTNRPEQVQSGALLEACSRVAVIDHHRRAASYIANAALNFHEPYASSACELVAELMQYLMEPGEFLRSEAEALMAGIMLDTKNFTMRTGGRTFEAAAFLRRAGADTGEVKKVFQNDLEGTIARYDIIQNARMYRHNIAIAAVDHEVGRVTAAQAADELLNICGIDASFVLFPDSEGRVCFSARSMSATNVQVILEQLGGGGNATVAGAQIPDITLEEATRKLLAAIDQYFESEDPQH